MTTIQIELPEATAQDARAAGLLTPQALDRLLTEALGRKHAADMLLSIADHVAAAGIEPMSMEEINAEVKASRADRRLHSSALNSSAVTPACRSSPANVPILSSACAGTTQESWPRRVKTWLPDCRI